MSKFKRLKKLNKIAPPPIPTRYCPRCENALSLSNPTDSIYDCKICETLLFEPEVDEFPGQTKGKPRPGTVVQVYERERLPRNSLISISDGSALYCSPDVFQTLKSDEKFASCVFHEETP